MNRLHAFMLLMLLILGFYAAWLYLQLVASACLVDCSNIYRDVIAGTALSPYRYRLLSFALVDILGSHPQTNGAIAITYSLAYFIAFPLTLIAYYGALRRWAAPLGALIGVVLLVMYLPVMMRIWGTSLYVVIELGLLSLALRYNRPGLLYGLLVIVATLNRETGILLVLAFAMLHLTQWRERKIQAWTLAYGLLWTGIYVGLRMWRGSAPDEVTIAAAWAGNTASWHILDAITNNFFFVPLFAAVFLAWRFLDKEIRRLLIGVGLPYLALVLIFGFWNEVRLWMPMMPLFTIALITVIENVRVPPITPTR